MGPHLGTPVLNQEQAYHVVQEPENTNTVLCDAKCNSRKIINDSFSVFVVQKF